MLTPSSIPVKTDEHGDVHLRLPDCRYYVSAREQRDRDELGPSIEWGPQGPTPAVLRFQSH